MRFTISAAFVMGVIAFLLVAGCTNIFITKAGNFSNASPEEIPPRDVIVIPPAVDNSASGNYDKNEAGDMGDGSYGYNKDTGRTCDVTIHYTAKSHTDKKDAFPGDIRYQSDETTNIQVAGSSRCYWEYKIMGGKLWPASWNIRSEVPDSPPSWTEYPTPGTATYTRVSETQNYDNTIHGDLHGKTSGREDDTGPFAWSFQGEDAVVYTMNKQAIMVSDIESEGVSEIVSDKGPSEYRVVKTSNHVENTYYPSEFHIVENIGKNGLAHWKCTSDFDESRFTLACQDKESSGEKSMDVKITSHPSGKPIKTWTLPITTETTVELAPLVPQDKPITTETTVDLAPLVPTTVTLAPLVPKR